MVCTTDDVPKNLKKKAVYFLKSKNIVDSLRLEDLKTEVVCGELTESGLETLSLLSHEVFFPLLSNPANRSGTLPSVAVFFLPSVIAYSHFLFASAHAGWSGPTSKELMLKFSNFLSNLTMTLGQSKVIRWICSLENHTWPIMTACRYSTPFSCPGSNVAAVSSA